MNRILLNENDSNRAITFSERPGIQFEIKDEIGRGASCVVYHAICSDNTEHLLKEYYPKHLELTRDIKGNLVVPEDKAESFYLGLLRFRSGCEQQKAIRLSNERLKNFTCNVQGYYKANATEYIDMTCFNGQTYDFVQEKSVYALMLRMKTLTQVVGNYHKAGLLHLDIKPANIYVRPEDETVEDVMLFDFDSVTPICELANSKALSCTKTWAAPEQLLPEKYNSICPATDLFAIGEIIFVQLFGRHSTTAERRSFVTSYNYNRNAEIFKYINPKVFPLLDELLCHTICSVVGKRYQSSQELIAKIEEIIKIANPEKPYVCNNFSYQSANFIGRKNELQYIDDFFGNKCNEKGNVLFISGLGGIGKTEIAKRYAYDNKRKFDRIIFLTYSHSIQETICQDDIKIYSKDFDEEKDDKIYKEKLNFMKADLTERDLIILDNFDAYDDQIEELVALNCKILVTTRLDFSDGDYPQLEVGKIIDFDEVRRLFKQYNSFNYSDSEQLSIDKLLQFVDCHTMTVCLIAKYLKNSEKPPSDLLNSFKSKEGITNTEDSISVLHKKDKRLKENGVVSHLLALFNLTKFTQEEKELLFALSCLGSIRIKKDTFKEIFSNVYTETILNILIERGWIEYDTSVDSLSLHQIILDLIYNEFHHDICNSHKLIKSIISYLDKGECSRDGKRIIASNVSERIDAESVITAELYCHCSRFFKHVNREEVLRKAADICIKLNNFECKELLFDIRKLQIECVSGGLDDKYWDASNKDKVLETFYKTVYDLIKSAWNLIFEIACFNTAPEDIKHNDNIKMPDSEFCDTVDTDRFAKFTEAFGLLPENAEINTNTIDKIVALSKTLDNAAQTICDSKMEVSELDERASILYQFEISMLRYAYYLITTIEHSVEYAENILLRLVDFYRELDYSSILRCEHFSDTEKAAAYSRIAEDACKKEHPNVIFIYGVGHSYEEAARDLHCKRKYKKSNKLIRELLDKDEVLVDQGYLLMADNYIAMKQYRSAIKALEKVLEYDKEKDLSPISTMLKIAEVYAKAGIKYNADKWYERILKENISEFDSLESYQKADIIVAVAKSKAFKSKNKIDEKVGSWILNELEKLDESASMQTELLPAYHYAFCFLAKTQGHSAACQYIMKIADKSSLSSLSEEFASALYEIVYKHSEISDDPNLYFEAIVKSAYIFQLGNGYVENRISLFDFAKYIYKLFSLLYHSKRIFKKSKCLSEPNISYYYRLMVEYYRNIGKLDFLPMVDSNKIYESEKLCHKKINYYAIAEKEVELYDILKEKLEVWDKAYDEYIRLVRLYEWSEGLNCAKKCCDRWEELIDLTSFDVEYLSVVLEHYTKILELYEKEEDIEDIANTIDIIYGLWEHLNETNFQEYYAERSMDSVVDYLIKTESLEEAIYAGLLKIMGLFSLEKFLCYYRKSKLTEIEDLKKRIDCMIEDLPEHFDKTICDSVLSTLESLAPIYKEKYSGNSNILYDLKEKYSFQDVESKL